MLPLSACRNRFLGIASSLFLAAVACAQTTSLPAAPSTTAEDTKETIHGVTVSDPYQWLEDSASPRSREWIRAQQAYTDSLLAKRPDVSRIREDVRKVVDVEETDRVLYRAGRYFIMKKMPGQQIASLYLREGISGKDRLLLDPDRWSADHSDTLELITASHDGKLLVYGVRHGGRDQLSIHFYDVVAGRELPDTLPEARYIYWSVPLIPNGSGFFYIKVDNAGPRLYEHLFGKKAESDQLIFGNGLGPEMLLLANISSDGATLVIHALHGASGSIDVYVKDLRTQSAPKAVAVGKNATFFADAESDRLYINTNWNAPKGRVMVASLQHPEIENWQTLIPENADPIEENGMHVLGGKVLVSYMKNARSELRVFNRDGKPADTIPLPGMGTVASVDGEWNSPVVSFSYASFQTPETFFSYSLDSHQVTKVAAPAIPAGLSDVVVEQVWIPPKTERKFPCSWLTRKVCSRTATRRSFSTGTAASTGRRPQPSHPRLLFGCRWAECTR